MMIKVTSRQMQECRMHILAILFQLCLILLEINKLPTSLQLTHPELSLIPECLMMHATAITAGMEFGMLLPKFMIRVTLLKLKSRINLLSMIKILPNGVWILTAGDLTIKKIFTGASMNKAKDKEFLNSADLYLMILNQVLP